MLTAPNIITVSRIVSSFCLMAVAPFSSFWFAFYAWCGASDVVDGLLARRMGLAASVGARFDSAADVVMVACIAVSCAPVLPWQPWMVVWIAAIFAVRAATLATCRIRFGRLSFLHTWANKATGVVLFLAIAAIPVMGIAGTAVVCCLFATFSSIEELVVMARMPEFDADCCGVHTLFP